MYIVKIWVSFHLVTKLFVYYINNDVNDSFQPPQGVPGHQHGMMGGSGPAPTPSAEVPPSQAPGPAGNFPQQSGYRGQAMPPQQGMPQSKLFS